MSAPGRGSRTHTPAPQDPQPPTESGGEGRSRGSWRRPAAWLPLVALALLLFGCEAANPDAKRATDQCLRAELFQACMAALPDGPEDTTYNDWAEVVEECESAAYYQSLRQRQFVAPECRA